MTEHEAKIEREVDRLYDLVVARASENRGRPNRLEAIWDGDSDGWMLRLHVTIGDRILPTSSVDQPLEVRDYIDTLRYGGDMRLFAGSVPPWPESLVTQQLGARLQREFGCELWFPSPDEPDDDSPEYAERDRAIECADCKKLIIPTDSPDVPHDVCHPCLLRRMQRARLRRERARLRREPRSGGVPRPMVVVEGELHGISDSDALIMRLIAIVDPSALLGDCRLEPPMVARVAQLAVEHVETLLESHDPTPAHDFIPTIRVEWRGRELDLEPRMTRSHRTLYMDLGEAKFALDAQARGLALEIFTNAGIKIRDGHLLGHLIWHAGVASVAELRARHADEFGSERAVDESIARLVEVGCVRAEQATIHVTRKGQVVGNSPSEPNDSDHEDGEDPQADDPAASASG